MFKQVRLNDAILKFYQRSQPIAFSNAETLYDDLVLLRDQILLYGDLSEAQTNYLNNFIEKFDDKLTSTTLEILDRWLGDGLLADIVRVAINEEVIESRDGEARLSVRLNRDKQSINNEITQLKEKDTEITAQLAQIEKKTEWMDEAFSGIHFIAHRGYSWYYPENTLKAYIEADRVGFYGWEVDPWTTSDGYWINIHDEWVDRTTNGAGVVQQMTLEQIKSLEITGGNNASFFKGLRVPTMEEIYDLASRMKNKPIIFLNNRTTTPIDAQRTKDLSGIIKKYGYEKKSILFIGDADSFDGLRKELPNVGICWDFGGSGIPTDEQLDRLATYTPNAMASIGYTVLLGGNGISLIKKCEARGIVVQAHTVNSELNTIKLKKLGVQSILSDLIYSV